ncbi:phage baseplate J-like protein [Aliivibrio wodanis]|uniref:Phage baseplate J-like protein n=1 Tax=Aliivibrio wodanis TaxID=80852 RepID=A0A090ILB6_9GAMM|nr:phage baseplate J-like protein [Aliivibrio wodanis]
MTISAPQAFQEPDFETLLSTYIDFAVEHCANKDQEKATLLRESLENDAELLAQITQALILKYIADIRENNYWALQMFRKYVTESDMVELMALQYNLKRQMLTPEDTSVYPPKLAVMESDEDLLKRFDLAPYQFHTTGTRMGYRYHALTLDERPIITLNTEDNVVTVRYEFPKEAVSNPVKDAQPRMVEPYTGKVCVAVLSRESHTGEPSEALLKRVLNYLNRDDIAQETDELTVKTPTFKDYKIHVIARTGANPNNDFSQMQGEAVAWAFAKGKFNLKMDIEIGEIEFEFRKLGIRPVVLEPRENIVCDWDEVPRCTEVVIDVKAE